ncbi:uncharacterized protein LOC131640807 [Vicia villosa]|uniref:uncharacterized protein LOC131640807 n=1 Tax=Vicia villosa TaxID=3911 RepID=UPI00273B8497|nr:uncharacterized protein LOC131640807 [Vicia villosa]
MVRVECKANCGFSMLCSRVGQKETFAIKTIKDTHTCARVLENRSANSRWVAKYVVKKMQTTNTVRISDIIQDMRKNYSVGITIGRAWKAKLIAKYKIEGDADNQYANLWRYTSELQRVHAGNTVKITIDRPIPTIQPRPFIGVDGCHLKTKYGGQLLIAVGRDPNDQYFPLAFGVVETETKESWRWFIQLLMEDVGVETRYVFISNLQKGMVSIFEEMSERIEHRLCLRHLYANFKKKFEGGALIRDIMMGEAKATYQQGWQQKMNELKGVDPKAWEWLMGVSAKSWSKHAFSFYPKCDVLMNNIAESFNATILIARDKPILTMCEWIRKYLMNRCSNSAMKLEKWPHNIMPIPRKGLDTEVDMSGHWLPTWAMDEKFQVTHSYNKQQLVVDIARKSCTCNFWELVGIPCRHAVAALSFRKQNPELFVDECYSRDRYAKCYGFAMIPINGQDMWPDVDTEELLPPSYKKGPGRPRKLRIRETGEEGARRRLPGVSYRCTKCDKVGHNVKSCKSKKQHPNGLKRKKKVKSGVSGDVPSQTEATSGVSAAETGASGDVPTQTEATSGVSATEIGASGNVPIQSEPVPSHSEAMPSQNEPVPSQNPATQTASTADVFGDITDDMISSIPDICHTKSANSLPNQIKKGKAKVKQDSIPKRRRQSERVKLFWFKKPIIGPGAKDQPITLSEEEDCNGAQGARKVAKKDKKKSIEDLY